MNVAPAGAWLVPRRPRELKFPGVQGFLREIARPITGQASERPGKLIFSRVTLPRKFQACRITGQASERRGKVAAEILSLPDRRASF
jgi:hypothetical protein